MTDTVQTLLRQRAQESCPATPRGEGLARDARHADCQIVLSDTAHLPLLEGLDLGGARVLDVGGAEWKELVSSADPDTAPFEEMRPSDLSMLIFTSGTSGGAEGGPRDPPEGPPPTYMIYVASRSPTSWPLPRAPTTLTTRGESRSATRPATNGWFYFAGRTSDWLRVDGENLAAAPIERLLLRHPDVNRVAVTRYPTSPSATRSWLRRCFGTAPSSTRRSSRSFLDGQSGLGTKMRPRYVQVASRLPATATNKVLKRELVRQGIGSAGDPVWERDPRGTAYRRR